MMDLGPIANLRRRARLEALQKDERRARRFWFWSGVFIAVVGFASVVALLVAL